MVPVISFKLDCRGMYDPWPIVLMKRSLDTMKGGEILELLSDDPASQSDMKAWSRLTGHRVVETFRRENEYSFYVQKKPWERAMADYEIIEKLDCTGMLCPMPVIKTKKAINGLQVGDILEMIATDPGSMPDMQAWARQTKHELLEAVDEGDDHYRFVIKKTH